MTKTIFVGSDHAGFNLKKDIFDYLKENNYSVKDLGPYEFDADDDYPDYAQEVCERVLEEDGLGILICGTGQGMDRAANKIPGIYAEVCWDLDTAIHAREHSDANVLCFGEKTVQSELAKKMVILWAGTPPSNEDRHVRRRDKIKEIEKKYGSNK